MTDSRLPAPGDLPSGAFLFLPHQPMPRETAQAKAERLCRSRSRTLVESLRKTHKQLADPALSDSDRAQAEADLAPLSIEPFQQIRILLSWGGPSDGFLLTFDAGGRDLMHGEYFYADWFTYAEESLRLDDAEMVAELYLHGDPMVFFRPR